MPRPRAHRDTLSTHSLLQLMRLASPTLPVGGFSYSEGLESALASGLIGSESAAGAWLRDQLDLSLARSDLPVLAAAFKAWRRNDMARIDELNTWVLATRESAELKRQTEQMGRSLLEWLRIRDGDAADLWAHAGPGDALRASPTWPVVFALATQRTGAPLREAMLAYAFGWCENMVQAALKAVPLGQSAGQRILAALTDAIAPAVDQALRLHDSERVAYVPMLAILSAQHETQYSRLFRS